MVNSNVESHYYVMRERKNDEGVHTIKYCFCDTLFHI